jgi:APA family basic amino acid/polyamine antiporter
MNAAQWVKHFADKSRQVSFQFPASNFQFPACSFQFLTMPAKSDSEHPKSLPRVIGGAGSISLVVGTVIGSGIFLVPHNVALEVGSVRPLLLVWVVGGVLALAGALSLAELGAAIPEAGGVYIYLREAYGKLPAFLYGWGMLLVIESGSVATLAVAFGIYAGSLLPLTPFDEKLVGCGTVAVLTGINIIGAREGSAVQTVFTAAKLLGLATIMGFALSIHRIAHQPALTHWPTPHTTFSSFGVALIGVLWAYEGWHMLSFSAGEVKDPGRNLPRSYLVGMLVVVTAYLGANLAYLRVLSLPALIQHQRVAARAMEVLAGPGGMAFVSGLILCSIFGAINGNMLAGPRAYFAMARDGLFFSSVGRVHSRYHTPAFAILLQGIWAIVLTASGSYQQLYTYVIFSGWIFYAAAVLSVIVLRKRKPSLDRPYCVWGYPVLPVVFSVAALAIVLNTVAREPGEALIGLSLILIGIPIYLVWTRHGIRG